MHAVARDDRGLEPVLARSAIDDERDATAEFLRTLRARRRADASKAVRTRRGERTAQALNHRAENRMRAHPHRDRVQPRRHHVRHDSRRGSTSVSGPGQKRSINRRHQWRDSPPDRRQLLQPCALRQMHDQRVEKRPLLRLENLHHRLGASASAASP